MPESELPTAALANLSGELRGLRQAVSMKRASIEERSIHKFIAWRTR